MKFPLPLALFVSCACATTVNLPFASAQDAAPNAATPAVAALGAKMTAAQIIEKARQTYAGFASYKGSCSVVSDTVLAVGDGAPTQNVSSASAQIEFERGKRLSIEGTYMGGSPFKAQWTPGETWLESVVRRGPNDSKGETKREIIKGDAILQPADALLAGLSGVTGGVGSQIPYALMPGKFGLGNPFSSLGTAKLLPPRNLGNVPCYVIEQTVPELNSVTTYWIEQKTFLLRRLTEEQGEQRYDDLPKIKGMELPIMRVAYSHDQFVFATTEAK